MLHLVRFYINRSKLRNLFLINYLLLPINYIQQSLLSLFFFIFKPISNFRYVILLQFNLLFFFIYKLIYYSLFFLFSQTRKFLRTSDFKCFTGKGKTSKLHNIMLIVQNFEGKKKLTQLLVLLEKKKSCFIIKQ